MQELHEEQHVYLLSNTQPHLYDNKANHFFTRLENPLFIPKGETWEVGLKEFGYVNNVDTIPEDCYITVGKMVDTKDLKAYLPYYTMEGTNVVRRHTIFESDEEVKRVPMITALELYTRRTISSMMTVTTHPSYLYYGGNGIEEADVYVIDIVPFSLFQIKEFSAFHYVLVFSPHLAASLLLDKCVYHLSLTDVVRIHTRLSIHRKECDVKKYPAHDYWFSVIPLHRCHFAKHGIERMLGNEISVLNLFKQLEWFGVGKLVFHSSNRLSFHVKHASSYTLSAMDYGILSELQKIATVTMAPPVTYQDIQPLSDDTTRAVWMRTDTFVSSLKRNAKAPPIPRGYIGLFHNLRTLLPKLRELMKAVRMYQHAFFRLQHLASKKWFVLPTRTMKNQFIFPVEFLNPLTPKDREKDYQHPKKKHFPWFRNRIDQLYDKIDTQLQKIDPTINIADAPD